MHHDHIPELEQVLKVLGNATRLRLLLTLQRPQRLADIRVESDGRPISRQAVQKHLAALEDIGAVTRVEDSFVVRHARVYEIVERMRTLATLHGAVVLDEVTRELNHMVTPMRPECAHLVTIRGVAEGATFSLAVPDDDGGWTLGRAAGPVHLDHDQFISSRHARIIHRDGAYFLLDLATNRNGTMLNWRPMEKGALAPLEPGDIIGLGMTRLVFRAGVGPRPTKSVAARTEA